jgi:multidrug efflux pump subunit AcrB
MSDTHHERGWIAWMSRNSVAANLLMLFLIIGGFAFTFQTRQEVFPEFDLDIVQITVPYLGATPEDVETGVLLAIEEEVRGLDGVKEVTAVAREGVGTVQVELLLGTDPNKALQDIKNAVDRISSFPEQVERITVSLLTTRRKVIDLVLYAKPELGGSAVQKERVLRELAEAARDRLMQKKGVTLVEVTGTRPLEISVEVPQANLRAYGLTLGDVADRIRRTARELPGGGVKTPSGEVLVRTDERRDFASEFRDIPIVSSEGTQVRLADIAEVRDTFADTDEWTHYNGLPAAVVQVYRVGDETPIEVSKIVRRFATEFGDELPAGVGVATQDDSSEIYADRVRMLLRNALLGLGLVLVVLGVFLNLKLAFWVTLGIPVSFLGAMLFLPAIDVSINMISLFAFIMALGMVVDDAIVVGENVYEMRQRGVPYLRAAISGARQIAVPVTFSVLTTMVAFSPMLFVPGFAGKIFRVIPAVIIPVFFISLVESLFILPAHLGHSRPARGRGPLAAFGRVQQRVSNALAWAIRAFYGPVVRAAVRRRYLTVAIGVAVLVLVIGFVVGGRIKIEFFPNVAADWAIATVRMPYGAPVDQTEAVIQRFVAEARAIFAERLGARRDEVLRGIQSEVGRTLAQRGPGGGAGASTGGHLGFVRVDFVPGTHDDFATAEFVRLWRERVGEIPGVESMTFQSDIGPGGSQAAIDVKLSHRDVATLERAASELATVLEQFPGVKDIDAGFSPGKRQRTYTRTPEAEALGLDSLALGAQVRHAFYGAEALRQQRGRDEVKVMVRLPEEERRSEYDIEELVLRTPRGGEIMLAEASRAERERSYTAITRVDARRVLNVTADVDREVANAGDITRQLGRKALPDLVAKYPGLSYEFEGEHKNIQESFGALGVGFALALLVIYAMLAVPLKSYIQPVVIMTAIPFGIVGAVLGHVVMGYDLSLMSMMGIVALAGVVVNDSLVLIHSTNERRAEGADAFDAVASAGVRRFRPILLTSVTTFFGLAPMIFETSMQARFLIPMGISLGYGVLMATFITLLLVPSLYLIIEDVRTALRTVLASGREDARPEARAASLAGGGGD